MFWSRRRPLKSLVSRPHKCLCKSPFPILDEKKLQSDACGETSVLVAEENVSTEKYGIQAQEADTSRISQIKENLEDVSKAEFKKEGDSFFPIQDMFCASDSSKVKSNGNIELNITDDNSFDYCLLHCQSCNSYFVDKLSLTKHSQSCDTSKMCMKCFLIFKTRSQLAFHLRTKKHNVKIQHKSVYVSFSELQQLRAEGRVKLKKTEDIHKIKKRQTLGKTDKLSGICHNFQISNSENKSAKSAMIMTSQRKKDNLLILMNPSNTSLKAVDNISQNSDVKVYPPSETAEEFLISPRAQVTAKKCYEVPISSSETKEAKRRDELLDASAPVVSLKEPELLGNSSLKQSHVRKSRSLDHSSSNNADAMKSVEKSSFSGRSLAVILCNKCKMYFLCRKSINKHNSKCILKKISCLVCGRVFSSSYLLNQHISSARHIISYLTTSFVSRQKLEHLILRGRVFKDDINMYTFNSAKTFKKTVSPSKGKGSKTKRCTVEVQSSKAESSKVLPEENTDFQLNLEEMIVVDQYVNLSLLNESTNEDNISSPLREELKEINALQHVKNANSKLLQEDITCKLVQEKDAVSKLVPEKGAASKLVPKKGAATKLVQEKSVTSQLMLKIDAAHMTVAGKGDTSTPVQKIMTSTLVQEKRMTSLPVQEKTTHTPVPEKTMTSTPMPEKVTSTPVQEKITSIPAQKTTSRPVQEKMCTLMQEKTQTHAPLQVKTSSTPVQEKKTTSTPVQEKKTTSTPVQEKKTTSTPVQEKKTTSTPVQEKTTSTPVQEKKTTSTPVQEKKTTSTPVQGKKTLGTPVQEKGTSIPVQEKMTSTLVQEKTSTSVQKITSTPVQEKVTSTPIQEKITSTPVQEKITSAPVQEKITSAPVQEKITSTSVQEKITSTSVQEKITSTPVQEKTNTSVQEKKTTSKPLQENTTRTPLREMMTSTLVQEKMPCTLVQKKTSTLVLENTTSKLVSKEDELAVICTEIAQDISEIVKEKAHTGNVVKNKNHLRLLKDKKNTSKLVKDNSIITKIIQDKSDTIKPVPNKSDTIKPVPNKSYAIKLVPNKCDTIKSVPNKSDTIKPVPNKSDTIKPVPNKSDTIKLVPDKSDTIKLVPEKNNTSKLVQDKFYLKKLIQVISDSGKSVQDKHSSGKPEKEKSVNSQLIQSKHGSSKLLQNNQDTSKLLNVSHNVDLASIAGTSANLTPLGNNDVMKTNETQENVTNVHSLKKSGIKRKKLFNCPMPKSKKIEKEQKYLQAAHRSPSKRRSVRLEKVTNDCPGCSEPIDFTTFILNTVTYELSFWCRKCAWDIMFLDFIGPIKS